MEKGVLFSKLVQNRLVPYVKELTIILSSLQIFNLHALSRIYPRLCYWIPHPYNIFYFANPYGFKKSFHAFRLKHRVRDGK